jgi:hypothetical protein
MSQKEIIQPSKYEQSRNFTDSDEVCIELFGLLPEKLWVDRAADFLRPLGNVVRRFLPQNKSTR